MQIIFKSLQIIADHCGTKRYGLQFAIRTAVLAYRKLTHCMYLRGLRFSALGCRMLAARCDRESRNKYCGLSTWGCIPQFAQLSHTRIHQSIRERLPREPEIRNPYVRTRCTGSLMLETHRILFRLRGHATIHAKNVSTASSALTRNAEFVLGLES